ncbi:MAG: ribulokinase [Bifidobacteriaceae bacterium]|jgi:L-ribulokinase|nr:ribulokinase [Bifidobacteriaceae bacterium]
MTRTGEVRDGAATAVAGVDFGSDSVRALVIDPRDGTELALAFAEYPRWRDQQYCRPGEQLFRQHPLDHLEALERCFAAVAEQLGPQAVGALAIDATASTVAPVDRAGRPLALLAAHKDDPDAMFWLWKDHTATAEAAAVNEALVGADPDHTRYQGEYSSEWWWAKILRGVVVAPWLRREAWSWMEHSDWVTALLTGAQRPEQTIRNSCSAGHKALYNRRLGGPVPRAALARVDPYLGAVGETLLWPPRPAGSFAGRLTPEWASRLQLSPGTVVGVGSIDAHAGAVGAGIAAGTLVKVMGTSTVDLFLADYAQLKDADLRSLCGFAEDSIVPGLLGGESGQAAFGDLFAWFARLVMSFGADGDGSSRQTVGSVLARLEEEAAQRSDDGIVGLDWLNGRRYPEPNDRARAAFVGLGIGHDAADLYRAVVIAAVMGSKAIFEGLTAAGLGLERMVLVGGVARKSRFVCQLMADALGLDAMVARDSEVCAKGAAIYAAVAAGVHASVPTAQAALCPSFEVDYRPSAEGRTSMGRAFRRYQAAASVFEGPWDGDRQ